MVNYTNELIIQTIVRGLEFALNTIYLTSITQKAQRTYRRVLKGADVGLLWSYMVEETGENHRPWTGDHYPATCRHRDSILSRSGGKRVF